MDENVEDIFWMERKECKDQEILKMSSRKSIPARERFFSMGQTILSGPVAADEERFMAAARNSEGEQEDE